MWFFLAMFGILLAVGPQLSSAQCQYQQSAVPGVAYQVFSPGYSSNYAAGLACSWTAIAPAGYKLVLTCPTIQIPCNDQLIVNQLGSTSSHPADNYYCGSGSLTIESIGTSLTVKLNTVTKNGYFYCEVKAVRNSQWNSCSCGKKTTSSRIVGGTVAALHEFPYQALLTEDPSNKLICSAALINPFYALTAAHCVVGRSSGSTNLVIGEADLATTLETSYTAKYKIAAFVPHGGYTSATSMHDIALVRTMSEMIFNYGVDFVCLPFKYSASSFAGSVVTAAGWGTTGFGEGISQLLLKVNLNVIANAGSCTTTYPQASYNGFMCTYTSGKDTCQYDSGSNLFFDGGRRYTVGVTSGGKACAGTAPTLNIRVTEYLNWIQSNAYGGVFCNI